MVEDIEILRTKVLDFIVANDFQYNSELKCFYKTETMFDERDRSKFKARYIIFVEGDKYIYTCMIAENMLSKTNTKLRERVNLKSIINEYDTFMKYTYKNILKNKLSKLLA